MTNFLSESEVKAGFKIAKPVWLLSCWKQVYRKKPWDLAQKSLNTKFQALYSVSKINSTQFSELNIESWIEYILVAKMHI